MIELAPRYVDATVKRWETLTGGKAVKATAGGFTPEVYPRGGEVGTSSTGASPQSSNEGAA